MEVQDAMLTISHFRNRLTGRDQLLGEAIDTIVNELNRVTAGMLRWDEDTDSDDNSVWTANSPYQEEGVPFQWRLIPGLLGNKILWMADHDSELGGEGNYWDSLDEAKAAIQVLHNEIVATEKRNAVAVMEGLPDND